MAGGSIAGLTNSAATEGKDTSFVLNSYNGKALVFTLACFCLIQVY